jgi:hypothetical protein
MTIKDIVETAVSSPEILWGDNKRQSMKLKKRISILSEVYALGKGAITELVLGIAAARIANSSQTIYFPNIGSSGSHLIQEAVNRSWYTIPLGEVYIPPKVVTVIKKIEKKEQQLFMESWHLLHGMDCSQLFNLDAIVVNTVHNANLGRFSDWTANFDACLIIRNPFSLVISRTFRKDEYRNYIAAGDDDFDYLKKNIKLVQKFYGEATNNRYKNEVAFEDFFDNPGKVSEVVKAMIRRPTDLQDFQKSLMLSISDGGSTNQFSGVPREISVKYKSFAINKMRDLAFTMGYQL